MNRKIFITVSALILVSLVVSACGPSQADIEKAVAQTETAKPTATPTSTHTPTSTPTKTPTVKPTESNTSTPTTDIQATQLFEARLKNEFSLDMKAALEKEYGCVLANWKDNSFELVCAKAVGYNNPEQLIHLAYNFTYAGGLRLGADGLSYLFVPGFSYIVLVMSDDESKLVRTTTDGETMKMISDGEITFQLEWEVFATIENLTP